MNRSNMINALFNYFQELINPLNLFKQKYHMTLNTLKSKKQKQKTN